MLENFTVIQEYRKLCNVPHVNWIMADSVSGIPGTDFGTSGAIVIELTALLVWGLTARSRRRSKVQSLCSTCYKGLNHWNLRGSNVWPLIYLHGARAEVVQYLAIVAVFLFVSDPSKELQNTKVWLHFC